MEIKVKLDDGAFMPERAHDTDAGADLRCREGFWIPPHDSVVVDTGVHIELPEGTCGLLVSKSGLNVNERITTRGLIDQGFTGTIKVRIYNHGARARQFRRGDKITQIAVLPVEYPIYVRAESIEGGERGDGGYGSTGR